MIGGLTIFIRCAEAPAADFNIHMPNMAAMELGKTLYVHKRSAWRAWLSKNHKREKEIWLIYYRKSSKKPRIPYNDAVEEALCFGWIDSTVKKVDEEMFAQRFTPRKRTSRLSQMNRERIRKLIREGKMTKAGLDAVSHAFKPEADHDFFTIPKGILNAIRRNPEAWAHFQKLPKHYVRIRIAYIQGQGRHSEDAFKRSLRNFIRITAKGKRFGMVRD